MHSNDKHVLIISIDDQWFNPSFRRGVNYIELKSSKRIMYNEDAETVET